MDIVERLRAGSGGGSHWMELHSEAANTIDSLRAQVAALEQDAKRYRWLRDKARSVDWTRFIGENGFSYESHCRIGPDGMDAAIDAAIDAAMG